MSAPQSDLLAVAGANPVVPDVVSGEAASDRSRELRARVTALPVPDPARARRPSRTALAVAGVVGATVAAGAAIGASVLTGGEVAHYLPQGSLVFAGAQPTCTAVEAGVSYRCRLARPPLGMTVGDPGHPAFEGAKFGTVGDDHRVNGGCIGLNAAGTSWACYVGERAVAEGILDEGVLGTRQAGPAGG